MAGGGGSTSQKALVVTDSKNWSIGQADKWCAQDEMQVFSPAPTLKMLKSYMLGVSGRDRGWRVCSQDAFERCANSGSAFISKSSITGWTKWQI